MYPETFPRSLEYSKNVGQAPGWVTKIGRAAVTGVLVLSGSAISLATHEALLSTAAYAYDASTGDYPWHNAPKVPKATAGDDITWGYTDKTTCDDASADYDCSSSYKAGSYFIGDQWGAGLRNCTSYVSWRIAKEFNANATGMSTATLWDNNAIGKGWVVDQSPEVGDIAHFEGDDNDRFKKPGHVAFVEEVIPQTDGSKKVRLAEYNQQSTGLFTSNRITKAHNYIDVNGPNPANFKLKVGPDGGTTPTTPSPDTDHDGVIDSQDGCPAVAGIPVFGGCPPEDIDRDGRADLVVVNTLATGSGGVEAHVLTGASGYSSWFANLNTVLSNQYLDTTQKVLMGDVNADHRADLVVVNTQNTGSGKVEVHAMNGATGFGSWVENATTVMGAANTSQVFGLADINEDNRADLVVVNTTNTGSGKVEVHALDAATHYSTWIGHWVTPADYLNLAQQQVLVGDANGDGRPDILIVNTANTGSGKVEVHELDGNNGFASWQGHQVTLADHLTATQRLTVGDVNADRIADLLVVDTDGSQTGSGKVEVHPLSGATHYSTWLGHHVVTPLTSLSTTQRTVMGG